MVEPVDPFKRGISDGVKAAPWATAMTDFGLKWSVDGPIQAAPSYPGVEAAGKPGAVQGGSASSL